jgi:predicted Zn-dependent protease
MSSLNSSNVRILRLTLVILILFGTSCSPFITRIPTVADEKLTRYVTAIGLEIVAVSEAHEKRADYQFSLAQFARPDILGLSTGNHQIYISYELVRRAYASNGYRWLLRHTLAHEIAHDVLGRDDGGEDNGVDHSGLANRITSRDLGLSGRITFRPYSRSAELAADRKAMEYWRKLDWNCTHWVALFSNFLAQGYEGDVDHPTKERLEQASQICSASST